MAVEMCKAPLILQLYDPAILESNTPKTVSPPQEVVLIRYKNKATPTAVVSIKIDGKKRYFEGPVYKNNGSIFAILPQKRAAILAQDNGSGITYCNFKESSPKKPTK